MSDVCELTGICKRYGNKPILQQFYLSVQKGECLAITGKSGSGKSTILNIIGLLETPNEGVVTLFGKRKLNKRQLLKKKIAYLFQNYALLEDETISYNLNIPLLEQKLSTKEKQERKKEVLEKVGLDVSLKQKVFTLSGGEQQRLAIARLMLRPFELLLADEPTGSLDPENRTIVLDLLKQFHKDGKTVIVVTHDPVVTEMCERVVHLN
ncbi:ABC transporter ATP-binding protein [Shouchella clausii]|jgi:putative ABC transport system ATP-binding protein|uniref:ABC transporter ATP-binding protein n=1 Tax=Shouchella clausii TaxID=79880 RepID=UPI003981F184